MLFQSTHPHGVRLAFLTFDTIPAMFQSTHPHGVRRFRTTMTLCAKWSFNPRTHTGCDAMLGGEYFNWHQVSIHAPTRGATFYPLLGIMDGLEFQSTHPHGVRHNTMEQDNRILLFQSTHPHGVRPIFSFGTHDCYIVSIHAPTRGATGINLDL